MAVAPRVPRASAPRWSTTPARIPSSRRGSSAIEQRAGRAATGSACERVRVAARSSAAMLERGPPRGATSRRSSGRAPRGGGHARRRHGRQRGLVRGRAARRRRRGRLVDLLLDGAAPSGFSAHRPPGHHAEPARAMGFCLFNNVAVAARHALDAHGLERVMIARLGRAPRQRDQRHLPRRSEQVLFVSIHQSPLYPGTGPAGDVGSGAGRGFTVNLPGAAGRGRRGCSARCSTHVVVAAGARRSSRS